MGGNLVESCELCLSMTQDAHVNFFSSSDTRGDKWWEMPSSPNAPIQGQNMNYACAMFVNKLQSS